jgi:chloride channel protein, CIC family
MAQAKRLPLAASGIFLLAAIVGGLGGLAGVGFRQGLRWMQGVVMDHDGTIVEAARSLSIPMKLTIPAVGGLAAGLIIWLLGKRHTPFGISDVMDMVGHRRSRINPWRSLAQIASSACSLASGGSLGREGAITQIGTTMASIFSSAFKKGSRNRVILLACGTAAGMASSYHAPLAGAIFVMEVILGSFAMEIFAPLVIASVSSAVVTRQLIQVEPIYATTVELSGALVFSVLILGILCGCGGILFNFAMIGGKKLFQWIPGTPILRLGLGGLAVGAIGIAFPQVFGNGQEAIKDEILQNPTIMILFAVLVLKIVATACTTGSGALGGVFTPTLVVGASFGAFFHLAVTELGIFELNREALVVVGMAGICAATTHAPITSVFLIFELTQDYGVILPVMLCSISASVIARAIYGESYYTARLRTRSSMHATGLEELALHGNKVRDVMREDAVSVHSNCSFDQVMDQFKSTRRDTIYVLDDDQVLLGRIHLHDIKYFLNDSNLRSVVIAGDLTREATPTMRGETLAGIIDRFDDPDIEELAVVASMEEQRLLGRITRRDLMVCLSDEVLGQRKLRTRFRRSDHTEDIHVQLPEHATLSRYAVPDHLAGSTVGSIRFPHDVLPLIVIEIGGDGREIRVLASPTVRLPEGSQLIVMGSGTGLTEFEALIDGSSSQPKHE